MTAPARQGGEALAPLWRQREYRLLWSGQVLSTLGSHAAGIVVPLLILAMTGSPAAVGVASALNIVPYLLLSLPVGALIDRWNRRQVMICCDLARALVAASVPLALWAGMLTLSQLYIVAALQGTLLVFFNLAEVAALPRVVAAGQLAQATAQNQAGYASAAIAGPALGSWLYQSLGRALPFVVDACSYLASAVLLWRLRTDFAPAPQLAPRHLRAEMMEGLHWLWRQQLVRNMALVTGISNAGDARIGLVFSCGGVGGVLGALLSPWVQRRWRFGTVILVTLALQALLLPLLALGGSAGVLGVVYGAIMCVAPIYNVVQFSHRLSMIPDGLQGRVNSAYRLVAHLGVPFGAGLCGLLIERWGARPTLAVFAAVMALLVAAVGMNPAIRQAGPASAAPRSGNPPPA
jgi:predicted MFS family arabinose efflux permease